MADQLSDTDELTVFAVHIRYPTDLAELLPGRERELFAMTDRARVLVLSRLGLYA